LYEGDHPELARGMVNLAADLTELGEHERARELDEQALAMRRRLYEGDHPDVAHSLSNLAVDLRALGSMSGRGSWTSRLWRCGGGSRNGCEPPKCQPRVVDPSVREGSCIGSGSVGSRLDRRGIQREQARSVWSRLGRRRASGS
jgi:hypothetical protein